MPIPPLWILITTAFFTAVLLTCICWIWLRRRNTDQEESESLLHDGRHASPLYLWCFHHLSLLDLPPQTFENGMIREVDEESVSGNHSEERYSNPPDVPAPSIPSDSTERHATKETSYTSFNDLIKTGAWPRKKRTRFPDDAAGETYYQWNPPASHLHTYTLCFSKRSETSSSHFIFLHKEHAVKLLHKHPFSTWIRGAALDLSLWVCWHPLSSTDSFELNSIYYNFAKRRKPLGNHIYFLIMPFSFWLRTTSLGQHYIALQLNALCRIIWGILHHTKLKQD